MAKQVQFRRGTSTEHNSFTGVVGEITVDTTNNTLRVHDGSTVGGNRLARFSEIVPASRTVTAGSGLSGGGSLTGDITLTLSGTVVHTNQNQSFTRAQRGTVVTLTDGATITPDFNLGNNFKVTLSGNRTLANPTNVSEGQSGVIAITQDGSGSRTLAYGNLFDFPGGSAPTLTTTSGATDILVYYVESASRISANLIKDLK